MSNSKNKIVVAALYKFAVLDDFVAMRTSLVEFCKERGIKGTLLLAQEGINGTVSGSRESIDALLAKLRSDERLHDLEHKESSNDEKPFLKMKVRLKKEIVTLRVPGVDPTKRTGIYIEPKDWNELISDPSVLLVDTRNKYETKLGTFENAIDPVTDKFCEFPDFCAREIEGLNKNKKIAMFCTGGIRCEKATSFLKMKGFENVYHLKGGILKYLEEIPKIESKWKGECFVFDKRVTVNHNLNKGSAYICWGCRSPLSDSDRESENFRIGVHCPHCYKTASEKHLMRVEERQNQMEIANERNIVHIGATC